VARRAELLPIKWSLLHFFNLSTVSARNVTQPSSHHYTNISLNLSESLGGPDALSSQFHEGIVEATKRQLHSLADKRKARAARANNPAFAAEVDRDEMALVEEIEDFALEDMGKMLTTFDVNHPLLVAVAGEGSRI